MNKDQRQTEDINRFGNAALCLLRLYSLQLVTEAFWLQTVAWLVTVHFLQKLGLDWLQDMFGKKLGLDWLQWHSGWKPWADWLQAELWPDWLQWLSGCCGGIMTRNCGLIHYSGWIDGFFGYRRILAWHHDLVTVASWLSWWHHGQKLWPGRLQWHWGWNLWPNWLKCH